MIAWVTGGVAFGLMMSWGRAIRGVWPGKSKQYYFAAYIFLVILVCNALYFYWLAHPPR
jgi:hypothetical protein